MHGSFSEAGLDFFAAPGLLQAIKDWHFPKLCHPNKTWLPLPPVFPRFSHVSDIWKGLRWKGKVMEIDFFFFHYSDISGKQAFYKSPLPTLNYVLKV